MIVIKTYSFYLALKSVIIYLILQVLLRIFLLLPLFMAYALSVVHAVFPHHHHSSFVEAQAHHASESHGSTLPQTGQNSALENGFGQPEDSHDHAPHFVHPVDFGYYLPGSILYLDGSKADVDQANFHAIGGILNSELLVSGELPSPGFDYLFAAMHPPSGRDYDHSAHLRGPPMIA